MFDVGHYLRMLRYLSIVKIAKRDFKLFIRAINFEKFQFFYTVSVLSSRQFDSYRNWLF